MADYHIGDKVRLVRVPPYLFADNPVDQETADFFGRCLGKVFCIRDFDEYGQLELWATDKGNNRRVYSRPAHTIWIEPEYVASYANATGGLRSIPL